MGIEVADTLRANDLEKLVSNAWKRRTLYALSRCRTAAMGGHIDRCNHAGCGKLHLSYNSCRNRHCPKCQGHQREAWVQQREAELLNVPYFHVVFTLPHHLNDLCQKHPKLLYGLLFRTAWKTMAGFADNPKFLGAKTGMVAVLHTWGQDLSLHPHLHCIVPGGGVTAPGKWKQAKNKGKYLFPVKAMGKVFRAKFLDALRKEGLLDECLREKLTRKPWAIYAKRPFGHPSAVVEYLGRYTHKVAISNGRIRSMEGGNVSFSMKDYRKGAQKTGCTLAQEEFIRRFALHILPKGFVRVRHYGILSVTGKKKYLPLARGQTGGTPVVQPKRPLLKGRCPHCKKGQLETIMTFGPRGPPRHWRDLLEKQQKQG